MRNKNSSKINPIFLFCLTLVLILPLCHSQCCLAFSAGACISCPVGMHLFRGNCLFDLAGCASYVGGFECGGCRGNYELVNGSCWHARFPSGLANATNFTVYMQSALQTDASMAAAQDALKNSSQLWVDWYSATLREKQTYLNSRSLAKTASDFMRNVTASSKIHYIFTGTAQVGKETILLYRFVYELTSGGGFADCLVGVEMLEGRENYIQLIEVKLKRVEEESGWVQVKTGAVDEVYILGRLTKHFPKITRHGFLKGFRREVDEGVNYTMFFMSNDQGVLSFVYLADKEELPASQPANTTTSPTTTKVINPAPAPTTPPPSPQASNQTTLPLPQQTKQSNSSKPTAANQPTTDTVPPSPSPPPPKNVSLPQMALNTTNVNSNPIFAAGYAVIMQQYGLSPDCIVQQLFSIAASPTVYGFYLQDRQEKMNYRFAFTVDLNNGIFQIVNYTQSAQPLITIVPVPSPAPTTDKKNTKKPGDNPIGPSPINPSPRENSTFPSNSSPSTIPITQFCGKGGAEYIDITNKQASDLFLPKINLLLHTMYETMLTNTRIQSAKYMLSFDPQASTSSIAYHISYVNGEGAAFNFEVAIVNNEFQLVSYPNTTKTDPPAPTSTPTPAVPPNPTSPTPSESDKAKDGDQTKAVNASTEGKTEQAQNSPEIAKVQSDGKNKTDEGAKSKPDNESAPIKPSIPQPNNSTLIPQNQTNNAGSSKKASDAPTPTTPPTNTQQPLPSPSPASNKTTPKSSSNVTSMPLVINIPSKNFTTQPRYKSLINILRSIYRIPGNATVVSMEMWNDTVAGDSKYQITFRMGYAVRWGDGNVARVSAYNLSVNPSSFVSVHSEKIEFIKEKPSEVEAHHKEATKDHTPPPPPPPPAPQQQQQQKTAGVPSTTTPPPIPPSPPAPSPSNSSVLASPSSPPSIALLGTNPSPYLKNLYQIFTRHSPSLRGYSLQSLKSTASNASGGITSYTQRLQFSRQARNLCFSVWYEAASLKNGPPGSNNDILINIIEYRAVGCGNSASPSPISANFTDEPNFNLAINAQLQVIARNQPVSFSLYQRAQSYYLIRFQAASFGQREVLIDSASLLVLRYLTSSKPVYSFLNRNGSIISSIIADALRANMQKIFRLSGGSLVLEWMGKSNDDEVMLLQLLGRSQVQSSWARPVYQHFTMRVVYWPSDNYIKIVGARALGLFSNQYAFKLSNPDDWTLIRPTNTFTDASFAPVLPSLASSYAGFLQNAQIVAVYRESSAKNKSLGEYMSSQAGARLLVGIVKRFSEKNEAGYLLTIRYYPTTNQTHIENIESVGLNSFLLNGCQDISQGDRLPQCRSCMKGYRLADGLCSAEIEGCLQYGELYCLRCRQGLLISKDFRRCLSEDSEQGVLLDVMGVYNSIGQ